jgi:tetratricopeptide (TPR) repeat protein
VCQAIELNLHSMLFISATVVAASFLLQSPAAAPAQVAAATGAQGQTSGADPRLGMWPAPTAEDWAKPVLITFQRTWEDAQAVSKETGKPILVCVNMDGEIASEHYAGIRYREPEMAKFHEPYVNVIASVYRHNPRDYDENGQRVPCPRFGSVTCGEHIAMEPIVYSMFLDQTRVSPRHIGVELDGTELYDVFYALDVKSVFETIDEGIRNRPDTRNPDAGRDRSLEELVASRDIEHRRIIEQKFRVAKRAERLRLLDLSKKLGAGAPIELLRMALFGLDVELASQARAILAEQRSEAAIDLIAEALAVPMPESDRELLLGALEAMAPTYGRAKALSVTLRGLNAGPMQEEVQELAQRLRSTSASEAVVERYEIEARLDQALKLADAVEAGTAKPTPKELAEAETMRAESMLRLAVDPEAAPRPAGSARARRFTELRFLEAGEAAAAAEEAGGPTWRTQAVRGLVAFYSGETEAWQAPIRAAFRGMGADPDAAASETASSWIGMAVMSLFADDGVAIIRQASRAGDDWPAESMGEVNTAFDLLAEHPLGTDEQAQKHHDFLIRMGARRRAFEALERGLQRFPDSWGLNGRFRERLLYTQGVDGMLGIYARRAGAPGATGSAAWYAGYAGLVGGEFRRRRSQLDEAISSYEAALAHFSTAVLRDESTAATSDHYAAMALAGMARVRLDQGDAKAAAELLLQAFERKPQASNALDGLNGSAVTTSSMVLPILTEAGDSETAMKLQAGLDRLREIDPALLEKPEFEKVPDTPVARNRDRRGRQR